MPEQWTQDDTARLDQFAFVIALAVSQGHEPPKAVVDDFRELNARWETWLDGREA